METIKENKMGVMSINKLIISMALPIMAAMLVQALYNVVDSIYIGHFSTDALTAISLAFPIQNLMIGVATGTGLGVNALLSKSLGEKNFDRANKVAQNGVFLAFVGYLLFVIFGIFGSEFFFTVMASSINDKPIEVVESIIKHGTEYISTCSVFSIGIFIEIMFERLMQATGKTIYTMFTQGAGAIVNIVLDPIFIFGYFGLPAMGAAGAAIATVIGQVVSGILAIILNAKFNKEISISIKGFRPDLKIIGKVYAIGIPSIVMVGVGSIMNFTMNKILLPLQTAASTVFGVYFKLQSFIFMPVFGLNNAVVPIIAYNYGAQNRTRLLKAVKYAIMYAVIIMLIGLLIMTLFPTQLLQLFEADDEMLAIGPLALRRISLSFIFAGICIMLGSIFQALSYSVLSLIVSIARQLCVLLPVAYLFSLTGDVNLIWYSFPIAEIASLIASIACFMYIYRTVIRYIPEEKKDTVN